MNKIEILDTLNNQELYLQAISKLVYGIGEYSRNFQIAPNELCYLSNLIELVAQELENLSLKIGQ